MELDFKISACYILLLPFSLGRLQFQSHETIAETRLARCVFSIKICTKRSCRTVTWRLVHKYRPPLSILACSRRTLSRARLVQNMIENGNVVVFLVVLLLETHHSLQTIGVETDSEPHYVAGSHADSQHSPRLHSLRQRSFNARVRADYAIAHTR